MAAVRSTLGALVRLGAWGAIALMGWLAASIALGLTGPHPTAIWQAVAPLLLLPALPIALLALWRRRWVMGTVAGVLIGALLALVLPILVPGPPPAIAADAPRLRVGFANLLASNPDAVTATSVLAGHRLDLLTIAELTPRLENALEQVGALDGLIHRASRPLRGTEGIGLYSRFPITSATIERFGARLGIRAVLDVDGQPVRVFVVHPLPPVLDEWRERWAPDLAAIGEMAASAGEPTLLIGDFNATYFHPPFRQLLRDGFQDVHLTLGKGLLPSWPNDRRLPPIVRLDHALVRDGLVPVSVGDLDVPGSDHRAFVTELALSGN